MKITIEIEPKEIADLINISKDQLAEKNLIDLKTTEPEKDEDKISEERFAEIIDGIYNTVHNPAVRSAKAKSISRYENF